MFRTILDSDQANSDKKQKNQQTIACQVRFSRKSRELSHGFLAVKEANSSNLRSKTFSFYFKEVRVIQSGL